MQLTNGAIKKTVSSKIPPPQIIDLDDENDGLDTFDLSAFVIPSTSKSDLALRPSDKDKKKSEIAQFISESEDLYAMGVKYETEVVARGHQHLYDLLASIYSLALRIEANEQANKIVIAIRKELKDKHQINLQTNCTPMAAIVRFVVRGDKLTASRYTKVLTVARAENLSAQDLPAYITRRGGVTQIQETEAEFMSKKKGDKNTKARTNLIREYFQLLGRASSENFQYAGSVIEHNEEKAEDTESSSFCVFIAQHVNGENYKIITANDLGYAYEDNLIKYMGKEFPEDLYKLERGLRNFKRQLSMDKNQPDSFRKDLERQLGNPMKHKPVEVIEMGTPIDDIEE